MLSSEPSLSPSRLRSFRLVRRWSLDDLAARMTSAGHPISRQAIHQFEHGATAPAPSTFRTLVSTLGLRPSDLLESAFALHFVAFRKTSRLGKGAQEAIKAEFTYKAERRQQLLAINGIQTRPWSLDKRRVDTVEGAEDVARWLRDEWHLGRDAISSLVDACEHNGVEVICLEPGAEGFSGLSALEGTTRAAFIAFQNRKKDGARQRMDLAHELAHLVFDPASPVSEEVFARRFAGALLLPSDTVYAELGARRRTLILSELRALKMRYGVSMQGWIRRAKDLHVISEGAYTGLQIQINQAKLRSDEGTPYVNVEVCDRDKKLAVRAAAEGLLGPAEAARLAGISLAVLGDFALPSKGRVLANLSRPERRVQAARAAAAAAEFNLKHPEDRVADVMDYAD